MREDTGSIFEGIGFTKLLVAYVAGGDMGLHTEGGVEEAHKVTRRSTCGGVKKEREGEGRRKAAPVPSKRRDSHQVKGAAKCGG